MLNQAWKDYQAWAKLARDMQAATGQWNLAALPCVVAAAICGAATTLFPAGPNGTGAVAATLADRRRARVGDRRVFRAREFSAPATKPAGFRRGQPPRRLNPSVFATPRGPALTPALTTSRLPRRSKVARAKSRSRQGTKVSSPPTVLSKRPRETQSLRPRWTRPGTKRTGLAATTGARSSITWMRAKRTGRWPAISGGWRSSPASWRSPSGLLAQPRPAFRALDRLGDYDRGGGCRVWSA